MSLWYFSILTFFLHMFIYCKRQVLYGELKLTLCHCIIIGFFLSCVIIIATTPLHEAAHLVMSEIDPYSEPVEFHLFDDESFLSSAIGCVIIKESYTGSFKDRPIWMEPIQELICISIQILITCIIVSKTLSLLINKHPNLMKTSKLR